MKFLFPNGAVAFMNHVPESEAIIAYTNEDCSELRVTEKYNMPEIPEEEVCWIVPVKCDIGIPKEIISGPKAMRDLSSCYESE